MRMLAVYAVAVAVMRSTAATSTVHVRAAVSVGMRMGDGWGGGEEVKGRRVLVGSKAVGPATRRDERLPRRRRTTSLRVRF